MKKKWEKMEETEEKEHVKEGSDIKKDSDIKVEQSCENFVDVVIQEMQVENRIRMIIHIRKRLRLRKLVNRLRTRWYWGRRTQRSSNR